MNLLKIQVPWWRKAWNDNPLKVILIIALAVRVLAAFFSKGYAFHDDHFDVIRVAQDWISGISHWVADDIPPNHSMFYAGVNAVLLYLCELVGITDPQSKMVFVRLIHALYSTLIVYYAFKITSMLSSKPADSIIVGLMLALLWFMPFLGVKNLVEMVCIPPILIAFYKVMNREVSLRDWFLAGLLFGVAFALRYHTVIFIGGLGIIMLFRKQFIQALIITMGFVVAAFLFIGIADMVFWEYPFQSVVSYFMFNTENAYNYSTGPFYRFFLTVIGFTVPVVSLFVLWGYGNGWKISKELMLAATLFFVIHSIFPNKQERFIIPFFPFFIILGIIGWNKAIAQSQFWSGKKTLLKVSWSFFWVLNIVATLALALTYSKKDRIEPLTYLSQKSDVRSIIVESSSNGIKQLPEYYLGGMAINYHELNDKRFGFHENWPRLIDENKLKLVYLKPHMKSVDSLSKEVLDAGANPNYVIFKRRTNLEERKENLLSIFDGYRLVKEVEIQPSYFDRLLHILNPRVHKEEVTFVYKLVPNS
ncbi:mannosyltransferase [Fulvivirga sp. RKSG066]|uniref:mannosyltransferase n=1 Tax=Fulvivirga aurantia TaxID=2529383 RepID=UPI0012BC7C80|nr:mannosyltransferase [Fulvivirga aurantia]MTI20597.1 mannosyltransferase [Fulvivirga aurantia]